MKVLKYSTSAFLVVLCIWQGALAVYAHQVSALLKDMDGELNLAVFISYSQPVLWLYLGSTLLLAVDIFRRAEFLVANSIGTVMSLSAGTILIQVLMVLGGYAPIFEMGSSN